MQLDDMMFSALERNIYRFVCDLAVNIMQHILAEQEKEIHNARDKKRYIANGKRKSNIKVIFGVVEYSRHLYTDRETEEYVYLFDKHLNICKLGSYSENLINKMIELVSEMSYRQAEEKMELLTNNKISHQSFWNIIQKYGSILQDKQNYLSENFIEGHYNGSIQSKVLFMEQDGVWLKMQKKDKPTKTNSSEMKIAINYTGWSNDNTLRYDKLLNKTAIAGFFDTDTFYRLTDSLIYNTYDMDSVLYKISNADGAAWTNRNEIVDIFQIDYFHIHQAIIKSVKNKEKRKRFLYLMKNAGYDELIYEVGAYKNITKDIKSQEAVTRLYEYLSNNRENLPRWKEKLKLKDEPDVKYKNMGVQENQNCTIITRRMKHRRMAWSKKGATNLAMVLCERVNRKTLKENTGRIEDFKIKKTTIAKGIKTLINDMETKKVKKKKNKALQLNASIPSLDSKNTYTIKKLRRILDE